MEHRRDEQQHSPETKHSSGRWRRIPEGRKGGSRGVKQSSAMDVLAPRAEEDIAERHVCQGRITAQRAAAALYCQVIPDPRRLRPQLHQPETRIVTGGALCTGRPQHPMNTCGLGPAGKPERDLGVGMGVAPDSGVAAVEHHAVRACAAAQPRRASERRRRRRLRGWRRRWRCRWPRRLRAVWPAVALAAEGFKAPSIRGVHSNRGALWSCAVVPANGAPCWHATGDGRGSLVRIRGESVRAVLPYEAAGDVVCLGGAGAAERLDHDRVFAAGAHGASVVASQLLPAPGRSRGFGAGGSHDNERPQHC